MRDLDLNVLPVFGAICSSGTMSRAAHHRDLGQPTRCKALARLRKQMGDRVFVRSGNGVAPTSGRRR